MLCGLYILTFSVTADRPSLFVTITPVFSLCYSLFSRYNIRKHPPSTRVGSLLRTSVIFFPRYDAPSTRVPSLPRTSVMFAFQDAVLSKKGSRQSRTLDMITPDMITLASLRTSQKNHQSTHPLQRLDLSTLMARIVE